MVNGPARQSWNPVVTMDFMATVLDVLGLERPASQKDWHFDGISVLPLLKGDLVAPRGIGWMYSKPVASPKNGYAFRYANSYRDPSHPHCTPSILTECVLQNGNSLLQNS